MKCAILSPGPSAERVMRVYPRELAYPMRQTRCAERRGTLAAIARRLPQVPSARRCSPSTDPGRLQFEPPGVLRRARYVSRAVAAGAVWRSWAAGHRWSRRTAGYRISPPPSGDQSSWKGGQILPEPAKLARGTNGSNDGTLGADTEPQSPESRELGQVPARARRGSSRPFSAWRKPANCAITLRPTVR